jgi:hypothetical protein
VEGRGWRAEDGGQATIEKIIRIIGPDYLDELFGQIFTLIYALRRYVW